MHALLNTNTSDDILFIQEPWFGRIGTARDDKMREGREVLGGAGHPSWQLLYPHYTNDECAKVMTYIRTHDRDHIFKKNYLKGSAHLDLCAHPCILITDISFHKAKWWTINFYNDVDDPTAIRTLLTLQLDPLTPTLLTGDFNSHSRSWSPRGWGNYSASAAQIEGWAASQGLQLLSEAGVVTH